MQANFSNRNNSSNLIKLSEIAKKKARRRLVGSVVMLLVALIILLNVTTKVKPIAVSPKSIQIAKNINTKLNSSTIPNIVASKPSQRVTSSVLSTASKPVAANTQVVSSTSASQVRVLSSNNTATTNQASTEANTVPVTITPKIINNYTVKKKPSPEEILNGITITPQSETHFIQIATSQNIQALTTLQKELSTQGIKTHITPLNKNKSYQLRTSTFSSEEKTKLYLQKIQDNLKQD